ncbi:unnamed protein product, partial [Rotaria magnacalcarata]
LMLKRSFRLIYIYGVLDCFKLFQVVSVMEITGGFGFNPVLSPASVAYNLLFGSYVNFAWKKTREYAIKQSRAVVRV